MPELSYNRYYMVQMIRIAPLLSQTELGGFQGIGRFMDLTNVVGSPGDLFEALASNIFGFLTLLAGMSFLLFFVLGAIKWITSGGDPQKVEGAKNQMVAAGIGLVAVIAAYTVAGIVSLFLGFDILNPGEELHQIGPEADFNRPEGTDGSGDLLN